MIFPQRVLVVSGDKQSGARATVSKVRCRRHSTSLVTCDVVVRTIPNCSRKGKVPSTSTARNNECVHNSKKSYKLLFIRTFISYSFTQREMFFLFQLKLDRFLVSYSARL